MRFRKSRNEELRRLKEKWAWSDGGSARPNGYTERGRTNLNKQPHKPRSAKKDTATRVKGIATRVHVERSSGNVFTDLGLPHPEQELLKAKLTLQIYRLIKRRGITQTEAGKVLGIKQPHVSALMRNRAGAFSVERLMDFLTALGQDIEITVRPTRKQHGEVYVVA